MPCRRQSLTEEHLEKNVNQDSYINSYTITEFRNNKTVHTHKGNIKDTYNLCNIIPDVEEDWYPSQGSMS